MKKSDIQDEIMNKIQRKIDKDIDRMKSKKDMDKSVEKQIRKQLLDLYLFQSENEVKTEKQRKRTKIEKLSKNVEKNAKKQQKNAKKQQKNSEILSKNSNEIYNTGENEKNRSEKDYYSTSVWKSMSYEMRKKHPECQLCCKNKSTEVHHIFPFMHQFEDVREEVFLDKDNLICLCSDCHHQVHAKNYGNLGIPERMKIEKLRNQISQKYLNQGKILSWL